MSLSWFTAMVLGAALFGKVSGQCSFISTFASSSWHDNTKGTLAFGTATMTGWEFSAVFPTGIPTINPIWSCVNNTDDTYIIMRTETTFSIQAGSNTANVYAYLCMKLTKISDVSYYYYQQQVQQLNLGGERLKVSGSNALTQAEVCDSSVTVPTLEFHVLVKSGSESQAAQQCPDSLLFSADYTYYSTNGQTQCAASQDVWDVCTNKTEMTFNYTTCSQQILFSGGGRLWCIFTLTSGYDYTVVYNQDTVITSGLNQFACLSVSDPYVSVAPGNCTATQTPFDFPKEPDGTTSIGHRLVIGSKYADCGSEEEDSGLSSGEIAAIVISVLYIVSMWTFLVVLTVFLIFAAIVFLVLMLALTETSGKWPVPKLELSPLDKGKPETSDKKDIPKGVPTTPTDIHLKNGGPKVHVFEEKKLSKGANMKPKVSSNPNLSVPPKGSPRKITVTQTSRT